MTNVWVLRSLRAENYETVAFREGLIAIGWPMVGDLSTCTTVADLRAAMRAVYPFVQRQSVVSNSEQLSKFASEIVVGDMVIQLRRRSPDVAVGWVTGPYQYRNDLGDEIRHVRPVRWARIDLPRAFLERDLIRVPTLSILHCIGPTETVERIRNLLDTPDQIALATLNSEAGRTSTTASEPPFANLQRNLNYARSLATAGQHLQQLQVGAFEVSDVFRAAWVQAVAALDHWVRQELRLRMLVLANQQPAGWPKGLSSFPMTLDQLERTRRNDMTIGEAVDEQLTATRGHIAYQHPDRIKEAFSLVGDVANLWNRVATVLAGQATETGTITGVEVRTHLLEIVNRRHKIAHESDEDPTNPPSKRSIDAATVTETIDWIEQVVAAIVVVMDQ